MVAIITLLAGMTLTVMTMAKDRAKELSTGARMQAVLNGLTIYASSEGSPAVGLQTKLNLGGVFAFAPVRSILDSTLGPKPPAFKSWASGGYGSGALYPSGSFWPGGWTDIDSITYRATPETAALWNRLSVEVNDVMPPPGNTWSTGTEYRDSTQGGWPTQWPETNWDLAIPGNLPPILRFPWGKPGLRCDGTLCDPNASAIDTGRKFTETTSSAGHKYNPPSITAIMNRWVTHGDESTGRIWKWSSMNNAQSDGVILDSASRSDGSAVAVSSADLAHNSNQPMPFDMGWMSPLATMRLLQAADVLPAGTVGEDAFRNSRKSSAPWNDAWGHPLVVVYAMFQPERCIRAFDGLNKRDLLLKGAMKEYQYNRSLYFAVGAPGSTVPSTLQPTWLQANDNVAIRDYWLQIRDVAGAKDWDESAMTSPPWKGVRTKQKNGYKCMLTPVSEIK